MPDILFSAVMSVAGFAAGASTVLGQMQKLADGADAAARHSQTLGQSLQTAGGVMVGAGGALAGLSAPLLAFGASAIETGRSYETWMKRIQGVSGDMTADVSRQVNDLGLRLGKELPVSANDAAQAMYGLATSGFRMDEILTDVGGKTLPEAVINMNLASGGLLDMEESAKLVGSTVNSMGRTMVDAVGEPIPVVEQANRVVDVLAKVANVSAAEMNDLSYTMKYAAPIAGTFGVSIEELGGAVAVLANQGMKGEMAGVALRNILLRLANPTKKARQEFARLGIETSTSTQLTAKSFEELEKEVKDAIKGMAPADARAAVVETLEQMGVSATDSQGKVMSLAQATAALNAAMSRALKEGNIDGLEESLGLLDIGVLKYTGSLRPLSELLPEIAQKTAGMSDQQLAASASLIAGGEAGVAPFINLLNGARAPIDDTRINFLNLTKAMRESAGSSAAAAQVMTAGFGGMAEQFGGTMDSIKVSVFQTLQPALEAVVGTALRVANAVFDFIQTPLGGVVLKAAAVSAALIAVVGVVLTVVGGFALFAGTMIPLIATITGATVTLGGFAAGLVGLVAAIGGAGAALGVFAQAWQQNWGGIRETVTGVLSVLMTVLGDAAATLRELGTVVATVLGPPVQALVGFLGQALRAFAESGAAANLLKAALAAVAVGVVVLAAPVAAVVGTVAAIVGALAAWQHRTELAAAGQELLSQTVGGAWAAIVALVTGAGQAVAQTVQGAWAAVQGATSAVWNAVAGLLQATWGATVQQAAAAFGAVREAILGAWDGVRASTQGALSAVLGAMTGAFGAILGLVQRVWTALVPEGVRSGLQTTLDLVRGIWGLVFEITGALLGLVGGLIAERFAAFVGVVRGILGELLGTVSRAWGDVLGATAAVLGEIGSAIATAWGGFLDTITGKLGEILGVASRVWGEVRSAVATVLGEMARELATKWGEFLSTVTTKLGEILTEAQTKWNGVKTAVTDALSGALAAIQTWVGDMRREAEGAIGAVVAALGARKDDAIRVFRDIAGEAVGALRGAAEGMRNEAARMIQGLIDGVNSQLNNLRNALNSVRNLLPRSPAKEGPLSIPVEWTSYLTGDLPRATRSIIGGVEAMAGGVRGAVDGLSGGLFAGLGEGVLAATNGLALPDGRPGWASGAGLAALSGAGDGAFSGLTEAIGTAVAEAVVRHPRFVTNVIAQKAVVDEEEVGRVIQRIDLLYGQP